MSTEETPLLGEEQGEAALHHAMLLDAVVDGIQGIVRTVSAHGNIELAGEISFWRSVAAGATVIAVGLLLIAAFLVHKVRTLLRQQPAGISDLHEAAYTKL